MDDNQNPEASLLDVLAGLGQGRFVEEATAQMRQLVKEMNRVAELGGGKPKGKLTITLGLGLDRGIFDLEPSIKITTPANVRARTIMYSTPDGSLSKHNTSQGMLALEGAKSMGAGEVIDFKRRAANDPE